jgi:hypothetical protein
MHDLNNCVDKLRFKADDAWPEQQEAILEDNMTMIILRNKIVNGLWFEANVVLLQLDCDNRRRIPDSVKDLLKKEI